MVAFLVLLYAVYLLTLVINGILLRAGVLSGPAPAGLTIVPAAIAGGVIVTFLLIARPGDLERRFSHASQEKFWGRMARRLATVPSTAAVGIREALAYVREPEREGWRSSARSGSGRRRSASSGPRFTPSTPRCPWRWSSRASSACSRT